MVRAGENVGVKVRLAAADSHEVRVALHVDRGVHGVLEFDPERSSLALDKPVLVDGAALEMPLSLRGWGAEAIANTALLMVEDQKAAPVLVVAYLIVPAPSWIEVRLLEKGVPTRRLGFAPRPAGEFHRVAIPLRGAKPGDSVLVTVLADRGAVGRFEPTGDNALAGADQPWVSGRVVVSGRLRLR
jgi:hypothetical protein